MGAEYADWLDEEGRCAKYTSRYAFFREMDEGLEVGGGGGEREGLVGVVLRHVEALREAVVEVGGKKEVKGRLLVGGFGKGWKSEW